MATLTVPAKLLCGGLAGATAQTVSYPLDVARRRMQLGQVTVFISSSYAVMIMIRYTCVQVEGCGMGRVLVTTYREAGLVRGLFRGMSINYLRAVPMTAVSFSVYESLKQVMGLQTGLKIST